MHRNPNNKEKNDCPFKFQFPHKEIQDKTKIIPGFLTSLLKFAILLLPWTTLRCYSVSINTATSKNSSQISDLTYIHKHVQTCNLLNQIWKKKNLSYGRFKKISYKESLPK